MIVAGLIVYCCCSYTCKSGVPSLECFQLALFYRDCGRSDSSTAVVAILVIPAFSFLNVFSLHYFIVIVAGLIVLLLL